MREKSAAQCGSIRRVARIDRRGAMFRLPTRIATFLRARSLLAAAASLVQYVGLGVVAYVLVFPLSVVRGSSMSPGIHDGDRILVDHLSYVIGGVHRGDVVVLQCPLDTSLDYIKRVIGLPGDEIKIENGEVLVNGEALSEPYVARSDGPVQGIFSPRELESQMRIEFERAQRHKLPIVCMLVAVDRLAQLQDLYGHESEQEILRSVIGVLRASTRDSDLLTPLADDRLLAIFPHTPPDVAAGLARRVLAGARKLRFERDGRTLGVSLSIGVAHNQHDGSL